VSLASAPWYEREEFRALAEVRRTFIQRGVPATTTPEAGAHRAAYWALYELGHVLDELERRQREGSPASCAVRAEQRGPGRIVLEIAVESALTGEEVQRPAR
jgi:hypothetical protein